MNLSQLPDNQKVYVCNHVFENERPVNLVVYEDKDLALLCGGTDHTDSIYDYRAVGLGHIMERQPDLLNVGELEEGYEAERGDNGNWKRSQIQDQS